jgi:hypothetical protein
LRGTIRNHVGELGVADVQITVEAFIDPQTWNAAPTEVVGASIISFETEANGQARPSAGIAGFVRFRATHL